MIRFSNLSIVIAFLHVACFAIVARAQVQLDRFFPPVVAIGGETTIKAEGKFPSWPVEVVCDRDDVKITTGKESGSVKVAVADDVGPGVAWVRMHDTTSASKLVPILIEPGQALTETEPNNEVAAATKIELPSVVAGRLQKSGDVDSYRVTVSAGQTLVISTTARRLLGSPMDAVLQLVDLRGNVLVQADDVRGIDPQIVYQVQSDAELMVRIFAFPETPNSTIGFAGSASFVYLLRVTTGAFVDHVLPLAADFSLAADEKAVGWNLPPKTVVRHLAGKGFSPAVAYVPGSMGWQWQISMPPVAANMTELDAAEPMKAEKLPFIFSGHISQPGEIDRVRFQLQKGKKYRASVRSREFGFAVDSVLRLVETFKGTELVRNDDRSRNQYDAAIEYSAKQDREVELQISDLVDGYSSRHAYSVLIEESEPSVELTITEDHYAVKAGDAVEIPIAVSRLQGFKSKLRITAEGLPDGVHAEAVESDSKGGSAKSVKLKLNAKNDAAAYQGSFRIVGHALNDQGNAIGESWTAFHQLRDLITLTDVWLTVAPAKP